MRILHVINALNLGGAEVVLMRLIKEQINQGHQCSLIVFRPKNNNRDFVSQYIDELNIDVIPNFEESKICKKLKIKLNQKLNKFFKNQSYDEFYRKLEFDYYQNIYGKYKFDLINSHLLNADFFVLNKLKPAMKIPFVLTSHGCYNDYKNIDNINRIMQSIDGMTYVAEKNLKIFKNVNQKLLENRKLIYNGAPASDGIKFKSKRDFNIPEKTFLIGQITRSIPEKGMEISVLTAISLRENKKRDNVYLILMGPENDYYNNLKEKYKAYNYILFLGIAMNPIEYVGMFDLGIFPSYFKAESCPSSIIEYLACGKPVVAANIGELPGMLDYNGEMAGQLVDEKDDAGLPDYTYFVKAIERYFNTSDLLTKHQEISKSAFKKFNISNTAKAFEVVYQKAIDNFKLK